LQVQRNGDSGSPRVLGSMSLSNSTTNFGTFAASFLRPPPGLRIPVAIIFLFFLSSRSPRRIVGREMPVILASVSVPPHPHAFASAATKTLRCFSFNMGSTPDNFNRSRAAFSCTK
jgi:hypothetical protein